MSDMFSLMPESKLLGKQMTTFDEFGSTGKNSADVLANDFFTSFKKIMGEVNNAQFNAEDQARALASGDVENIHDVALAVNKAKFMIDLTVKVREKVLDAYRELSQMR